MYGTIIHSSINVCKAFREVTTQSVSEPCFGVFEYDFQFIKKCLQLLDQHLCQFVNVSPDLLRSYFSIRHNGCDDCAATPWPHSFRNSWWSGSCLPHCLITSSPGQRWWRRDVHQVDPVVTINLGLLLIVGAHHHGSMYLSSIVRGRTHQTKCNLSSVRAAHVLIVKLIVACKYRTLCKLAKC